MTTISHIVRGAVPPERFVITRDNGTPPGRRVVRSASKGGLWQAVLDRVVPWGYEDETGFHFGRSHKSET